MKILNGYDLSNFKYIGNYNFDLPKELIPSETRCLMIAKKIQRLFKKFKKNYSNGDFVDVLLECYENYNLRKNYYYTEEGIQKAKYIEFIGK